jgi:hypothetical protein
MNQRLEIFGAAASRAEAMEPIRLNRLLPFPPTAAIQTRLTLARRRRHIKLMIFIHECLALSASLEARCFASALPKCGVRLPRRNHSLRFGCFLISDQVSTSDRSLLELGCRRPSIRGLEDRRLKLRIIACLEAQQFRGGGRAGYSSFRTAVPVSRHSL